jgi:hypothetical protein
MPGLHANGKPSLTARFHAGGVFRVGLQHGRSGRLVWRVRRARVSENRTDGSLGMCVSMPDEAKSPALARNSRCLIAPEISACASFQMLRRSDRQKDGHHDGCSVLSNGRTLCEQACRWLAAGQPGWVNQTASSNPGREIAGTTHDAAYHSAHAVQRPASNVQCPSPPFPLLSPQTPSLYSASLHFIPHFFQQDAACSPRRALDLPFPQRAGTLDCSFLPRLSCR